MVVLSNFSDALPSSHCCGWGRHRIDGDGSFGSQDEMNCVDPEADGSLILVCMFVYHGVVDSFCAPLPYSA